MLAVALALAAAVPQVVVSTGRLTDGQDKPITGLQTLTFSLFTSSVKPQGPETPAWTETYKTQLDASGLYQVALGGTNDDSGATDRKPFDAATWAGGEPRYLEIAINAETLAPRVIVGSAPFAFTSGNSLSLGGNMPDYYATAASDAAKLPLAGGTLSGALTGTTAAFSGAVTGASFTGAHAGDGSELTNVTGTDATKLALAGGTLSGALTGTSATFSGAVTGASFTGAHVGDGSMLTNVAGTDATKLALAGGTLSGALTGTSATFSGAVGAATASIAGAAALGSLGVTGAATAASLAVTGSATAARLGAGTTSPGYPMHAVGNDYNIVSETTSASANARIAARGPGAQDQVEIDATPGLAMIQSGKSSAAPLAVSASNWSIDKTGNLQVAGSLAAGGTVVATDLAIATYVKILMKARYSNSGWNFFVQGQPGQTCTQVCGSVREPAGCGSQSGQSCNVMWCQGHVAQRNRSPTLTHDPYFGYGCGGTGPTGCVPMCMCELGGCGYSDSDLTVPSGVTFW